MSLQGNLDWIAESKSLKWIFVGGKGGVGKTTVCCSLAVQLAKRNPTRRILLISTDPAHNTSDAFIQKFSREPTPVTGFQNLHCMEIDSSAAVHSLKFSSLSNNNSSTTTTTPTTPSSRGGLGGILSSIMPDVQDIAGAMPGIDEAISFGEMLNQVHSLDFDLVLFDTAPTGHTLKLLGFPRVLTKGLSKIVGMQSMFSGMFSSLFSSGGDENESQEEERRQKEKMQNMLNVTEEIMKQFKDPELTTFIPVMIAEFLSLYETERLIQELSKFEMDVSSIVINQLVPDNCTVGCAMCSARKKMQQRYVSQAFDLYGDDFHIVSLPLLDHEVRGLVDLESFGKNLFSSSSSSVSSSSSAPSTSPQ